MGGPPARDEGAPEQGERVARVGCPPVRYDADARVGGPRAKGADVNMTRPRPFLIALAAAVVAGAALAAPEQGTSGRLTNVCLLASL